MKEGKGWTLIARVSNNDGEHWKGSSNWWTPWWNDEKNGKGKRTDPNDDKDMISPAFWLVGGNEFMITRSDDPYTALLKTTDECLGKQTFRDKIQTSKSGKKDNQCGGSCNVTYGGQYRETDGFVQANKNGCSPVNLQTGNKIGFWCKYIDSAAGHSHYNWAVTMIGAGGGECSGADHGIGIGAHTKIKNKYKTKNLDFGNTADGSPKSYSLNLWVR